MNPAIRTITSMRRAVCLLVLCCVGCAGLAQAESHKPLRATPEFGYRRAEYDPTAPYCRPDTYAPDGVIVHMGPYYFRLCWAPERPHGQRLARVTIDPRRVPGLTFANSVFGMTLDDRFPYREHEFELDKRWKKAEGTIVFGGATYEVFNSGAVTKDGLPGAMSYVLADDTASASTPLPLHSISCAGKIGIEYPVAITCIMHVWYDGVWAHLMFIGGGGRFGPIPADDFPEFARDVVRVLNAADVTENRSTLAKLLSIVE